MMYADMFRKELDRLFRLGMENGLSGIVVRAGDLHKKVISDSHHNMMPNCCRVMRDVMEGDDEVLKAPPSGDGANVYVLYWVPRSKPWAASK